MPQWKKYEFPPTMLDVEKKATTIGLTPEQVDQIWLTRIQSKIDLADNAAVKNAWVKRKVRLEEKMAKNDISNEFSKDFVKWLVGRSPWNSKKRLVMRYDDDGNLIAHPAVDANGNHPVALEEVDGCPWGNQPLTHLPDVVEFVDQGPERRGDVIKQLTKLKMTTPRNVDEAYIYYKYILRNFGIDEHSCKELDDLMGDFDYPRQKRDDGTVDVWGPQGDTTQNNGMGPGMPPLFDEATYNQTFGNFYAGIYGRTVGLNDLANDQAFHALGAEDQGMLIQQAAAIALQAQPPNMPAATRQNAGPNTANRTAEPVASRKSRRKGARDRETNQRRQPTGGRKIVMDLADRDFRPPKPGPPPGGAGVLDTGNVKILANPKNVDAKERRRAVELSAIVTNALTEWSKTNYPQHNAQLAEHLQKGFDTVEKKMEARFKGLEEIVQKLPTTLASDPAFLAGVKGDMFQAMKDFFEGDPDKDGSGMLAQLKNSVNKAPVLTAQDRETFETFKKTMLLLQTRMDTIEKAQVAAVNPGATREEIQSFRKEMMTKFDEAATNRETISAAAGKTSSLLDSRTYDMSHRLQSIVTRLYDQKGELTRDAGAHVDIARFDESLKKTQDILMDRLGKIEARVNVSPVVKPHVEEVSKELRQSLKNSQVIIKAVAGLKAQQNEIMTMLKTGQINQQEAKESMAELEKSLREHRAMAAVTHKNHEQLIADMALTVKNVRQINTSIGKIDKDLEEQKIKESNIATVLARTEASLKEKDKDYRDSASRAHRAETQLQELQGQLQQQNDAPLQLQQAALHVNNLQNAYDQMKLQYEQELGTLKEQLQVKEFANRNYQTEKEAAQKEKLSLELQLQTAKAANSPEVDRLTGELKLLQQQLDAKETELYNSNAQMLKYSNAIYQAEQASKLSLDQMQEKLKTKGTKIKRLEKERQGLTEALKTPANAPLLTEIMKHNEEVINSVNKISNAYNYSNPEKIQAPTYVSDVGGADSQDAEMVGEISDSFERAGIPFSLADFANMDVKEFIHTMGGYFQRVRSDNLVMDKAILGNLESIAHHPYVPGPGMTHPGDYSMGQLMFQRGESGHLLGDELFGSFSRADRTMTNVRFSDMFTKRGTLKEKPFAPPGVETHTEDAEMDDDSGLSHLFNTKRMNIVQGNRPELVTIAAMGRVFNSISEAEGWTRVVSDKFVDTLASTMRFGAKNGSDHSYHLLAASDEQVREEALTPQGLVEFNRLHAELNNGQEFLPYAKNLVSYFANSFGVSDSAMDLDEESSLEVGLKTSQLTKGIAGRVVNHIRREQAESAQERDPGMKDVYYEPLIKKTTDMFGSIYNLGTESAKGLQSQALNLVNAGGALFDRTTNTAATLIDLLKNDAWKTVLHDLNNSTGSAAISLLKRYLPHGSFEKLGPLLNALTENSGKISQRPVASDVHSVADGPLKQATTAKVQQRFTNAVLTLQGIQEAEQKQTITPEQAEIHAMEVPVIREVMSLIDSLDTTVPDTVRNLSEMQLIRNMTHILIGVGEEITEGFAKQVAPDQSTQQFMAKLNHLTAGLVGVGVH